ncbi:hypothetical protein [Clostridium sp. BL-8]|uniref:hypothetical protein n=1 Tax=Clostridium sp. BL-8 TaxID=349938 RepID=UPI00098BE3DC|nr:hypothetical protein [Clostridium sp. BL-8]OOM69525.1 hypothetical protein CLOBL_52230 [Clostridium sp. BL-8]
MDDILSQFASLGSTTYYFTLFESMKSLCMSFFFIGLLAGYFGREFENLFSFFYRLFRKYSRLRRIKRRFLSGGK